MYTNFFGLGKRPFLLTPDPRFLYLSGAHDLAYRHLEYGLLQHAGFVALTGEVGAGKTTLLKYLFERVKTTLEIAMIFNTLLDPRALLEMLLREFELTAPAGGKAAAVGTLYEHFMKQYGRGKRCVIIIDEAQNLSLESFEELRMLSNLEAGNDVLVQIILVGQPQLRERLAHPSLAQLTQRISVYYHLGALSRDEVGSYVAHRLTVAGREGSEPLFTEEAIACLAELSRGIPRTVNAICDTSLTYAFADERTQVTREIIDRVFEDNELLMAGTRGSERESAAEITQDRPPVAAAVPASVPADGQGLLSGLRERLTALEMRMRTLEADHPNDAVIVLREILEKERERSFQYLQQVLSLNAQRSELESQLAGLKQQLKDIQTEAKSGKPWRVFRREKQH